MDYFRRSGPLTGGRAELKTSLVFSRQGRALVGGRRKRSGRPALQAQAGARDEFEPGFSSDPVHPAKKCDDLAPDRSIRLEREISKLVFKPRPRALRG